MLLKRRAEVNRSLQLFLSGFRAQATKQPSRGGAEAGAATFRGSVLDNRHRVSRPFDLFWLFTS
jgi:hypothetical protein